MSGPVPEAQQRIQPHQEVGMMIQANGLGRAAPGPTWPGAKPRLHSLLEGRGLFVLEPRAPRTPSNRCGLILTGSRESSCSEWNWEGRETQPPVLRVALQSPSRNSPQMLGCVRAIWEAG